MELRRGLEASRHLLASAIRNLSHSRRKEIALGIRRDVNGWKGRTARNAEPVDPAIRTTHAGQSMVECVVLTGT
jgi:hypothetical protein